MEKFAGRAALGGGLFGGVAYGVGAGAVWGLMFLAPELARNFSPLQLAAGRYVVYGVISFALLARRREHFAAVLTRQDVLALAGLAFVGNIIFYIALGSAVQRIGVALTSLITGFMPVLVTIVGSRESSAVPLIRLIPSLGLCIIGVFCIGAQAILVPGNISDADRAIGIICAVSALLSWTAFAVFNARWLSRNHHVSPSDWSLLIGIATGVQALCLVPVAAFSERFDHDGSDLIRFGIVAVGIAVLGSLLGTALWNRMSKMLPLTLVGQMIVFETIFALIYGCLWERRGPTGFEMVALGLIVASVLSCVAAHRGRRPEHLESESPQIEQAA